MSVGVNRMTLKMDFMCDRVIPLVARVIFNLLEGCTKLLGDGEYIANVCCLH